MGKSKSRRQSNVVGSQAKGEPSEGYLYTTAALPPAEEVEKIGNGATGEDALAKLKMVIYSKKRK